MMEVRPLFSTSMSLIRCYRVMNQLVILISLFSGRTESLSFTIDHAKDCIRGGNRLFLGTAVVKEWTELLPLGIFHGITTNPTLLERAGQECTVSSLQSLARTALDLPGCNEFLSQTWGVDSDEMYSIGMELSEIDRERIVVQVPVTYEGTKAASRLIDSGVRVCLTACYSKNQAIVAAGLGAEYIVPYLGRMMDSGKDGVEECKQIQEILSGMGSKSRILVASIRTANMMVDLTSSGIKTFTFSPDVARELLDESLTSVSADDFNDTVLRCNTVDSDD